MTKIQALFFWTKIKNRLASRINRTTIDLTVESIASAFDLGQIMDFYDKFLIADVELARQMAFWEANTDSFESIQTELRRYKANLNLIEITMHHAGPSNNVNLDPYALLSYFAKSLETAAAIRIELNATKYRELLARIHSALIEIIAIFEQILAVHSISPS